MGFLSFCLSLLLSLSLSLCMSFWSFFPFPLLFGKVFLEVIKRAVCLEGYPWKVRSPFKARLQTNISISSLLSVSPKTPRPLNLLFPMVGLPSAPGKDSTGVGFQSKERTWRNLGRLVEAPPGRFELETLPSSSASICLFSFVYRMKYLSLVKGIPLGAGWGKLFVS